MKMKAKATALVIAIIAGVAAVCWADGWETVGGNSQRNGLSLLVGPTYPEIFWEDSQSAWFGGQIYIEGDKLVSMRFQGISVAPIVCHDLYTGEELWSFDFEGTNSRSVPRGFRDGQIYATNFQETGHDTLYALNPLDGDIIWRSQKTVDLGIVWAVVYDSAGNIIIPGSNAHLAKIDKTNGHIIWDIPRSQPNTGAEGVCVYGNTVYGWTGYLNTPKVISAWDINDGHLKYSSATLPGDGDQEISPSIGPDGTIYAKRDGGNLYALRDNGSGIAILWDIPLAGDGYTAQFAIAADSSIYVPDGTTLVRLNPLNGAILNRSEELISSPPLCARITIDSEGHIYAINGAAEEGALYFLTPSLEITAIEPLPYNYYSGPALGDLGCLAVAGNNNSLKVFNTFIGVQRGETRPQHFSLSQNYPNPFNPSTNINYYLESECRVTLIVFNTLGQQVKKLADETQQSGAHSVTWDGRDEIGAEVTSGIYLYRLETETGSQTFKMTLMR